ncbi:T9SS type A sorting domain-containing protein [bacterium]|nr:T9SS type A sorting domain-containing protein [bacterium]
MPLAAYIGDVAIDPLNSQHLYVRQGGYGEPEDPALGVWETMDGGQHWEQILQGNIFDLSLPPDDADVLVAASEDPAVLLTRDGGDSWTDITGSFPWWEVRYTVISRADERIYIVAYAADGLLGMWATNLDLTGVDQAPRPGATLAAYPNPFNPTTALKFSLREEAAVSVFVTDVQGRRVRSLVVRESRPAGEQSLAWDGRDDAGRALPSGLYVAQIEAADARASCKLLLLR